jgi:V/A-type H+/Na+-transporting ATPase subunit C
MIYNALNFGYSNARIKSMASQLIDRGRLERMIKAQSTEAAIEVLSETAYGPHLMELSAQERGPQLVDMALNRQFSTVCGKVMKMTPSSCQLIVWDLLARWDIEDIKTILLAKHLGKTSDETLRQLTFCGSISPQELEGMLGSFGVQNAVRALGDSEYGKALMELLGEYERTLDIGPLLAQMDRAYLQLLAAAVYDTQERQVRSLIMADIDLRNIMTVLRCRSDGSYDEDTIRGWLVPAGNIGAHQLETLITARDWKSVVPAIGEYDLSGAQEAYERDLSLTHFEDALEGAVQARAMRTYRTSVLSLGVIIGFLYIKEDELRTIRRIIRGIEYGLSPEAIKETVFRAA